jgi:alpha-beta hydrolase superfamily lysophospholipase
MKILFLHGWHSTPGGMKPTYLKDHGHEVLNPALPDDDFDAAVDIAQAEFDQHRPDIVVGSSRGGAVAMNINVGSTRLVLLCPAWKKWGTAKTVKPGKQYAGFASWRGARPRHPTSRPVLLAKDSRS